MTLPAVRPPFTDPSTFPSVLDEPAAAFAALGLPPPLVRALAQAGIDEPFPVQAATIPDVLAGRDVLARVRTGSVRHRALRQHVLQWRYAVCTSTEVVD